MNPPCIHCGEPITDIEQAIEIAVVRQVSFMTEFIPAVAHIECAYRAQVGGIGHHTNHAYWCDQIHDPDGGRTYRQSALEVTAGRRGHN